MNEFTHMPEWLLRLAGAEPAPGNPEVWFGFEGLDPGWALLIAGIAAVVICHFYLRGPGRKSAVAKMVMASLRVGSLLLLLLLLMRPVLRVTEKTTSRGALLVLQDASASMDMRDSRVLKQDLDRVRLAYGNDAAAIPEPSRRELVEAVSANAEINLWPRITEKFDVLVSTFGRTASDLKALNTKGESIAPEEAAAFFKALPKGESATAVADSLGAAFEMTTGRPLSGVLLISDGVNNAGAPIPAAVDIANASGVPIFVYAPGVEEQSDLSILSFSGPAMAFAREDTVLDVRLSARGLEGQETEVYLKEGNTILDRRKVAFDESGEMDITFTYDAADAGEYDLTVEAKGVRGEATAENNAANYKLRVLDRRVKVLLIEQEPRWDFRYLLDTLKRDQRVEVHAVMLDGDATLGTDPSSRFLKKLPTPEELLEYVIVVIGDVDPARLSKEHLEALDTLTRKTGGGLVFHAGIKHNPFSYGGTLLEELLPVVPLRLGTDRAKRYTKPVPLVLTREGRRSGLLSLDSNPAVSETIWRDFPGVRWTAQTGSAKPAAEVLLVDPSKEKKTDGKPQPVLVRMSVGRGQIFYFGFDETWRWRSHVGERHYLRVWGQVFLKLGLERLTAASDLVQLNTVRGSYAVGETVLVSGRIFEPDFEPLLADEIPGTLMIEPTSDTQAEPIKQAISLKARPGEEGDYEVEVLGATPGRYSIWTDRAPEAVVTFDVDAANLEMRDPSLNMSSLEKLAGEEGLLFREENLGELPERLTDSLPTSEKIKTYDLAFHPLVYGLLLLLFTSEWLLRRTMKLK